ncbi:MAG TPA: hypothetical protein VIT44_07185 [Cyclobacteriaceae bacterium]
MSDSKIQIKIGIVEFSGEGNAEWLGAQLDKILEKIPELLKIELADQSNGKPSLPPTPAGDKPTNLSNFLREKNSTTNQTKKFLATAAFLQLNGKSTLSTNDVTKALDDAKQIKLNNPSLCLTGNITKGYCDKSGKDFYVTPEGFTSIGITQ